MREARTVSGLLFGSGIVVCVLAAALAVATLICLSRSDALGSTTLGFLAGASTTLVASFIPQLMFLVARFILDRAQDESKSSSPNMQEVGRRPPVTRVKTIPYSSTSPFEPATRNVSMDSKYPLASSGGFSSVASSFTNAMRPISSRTRLLSSSHSLRSDSMSRKDRLSSAEDFDCWDTSSVDAQNRQTVLESSSPTAGGHFLETIPASPTTSRSPSPGTPLDLDIARHRRRSRSYSPASMRTPLQPPQRAFTQQTSVSESHIHPLFRSDSPTPPPLASPGTVVIAAPQAGQIFSDRQSIRSLSRVRSGSMPQAHSPLTRTGSIDTFSNVANANRSFDTFGNQHNKSISVASEGGRSEDPSGPGYNLSAGSTSSLHVQQVRKTQSREGPSGPGLDALPGGATW
ncbi:hypothetical protein VSDG_04485 [Cytospora chrysosperma]|uniref:Uncharacterized protein n=1 Tax=Cytospora chrysosperma TaxID=252740 RepID=A0A423W4Q0_CYTCH|nr:hypothetical protein VSDG_04485 [Valsa sordida]